MDTGQSLLTHIMALSATPDVGLTGFFREQMGRGNVEESKTTRTFISVRSQLYGWGLSDSGDFLPVLVHFL